MLSLRLQNLIVVTWKIVVDLLQKQPLQIVLVNAVIVFVHRRSSLGNRAQTPLVYLRRRLSLRAKEEKQKKMVVDSRLRESLAQQTETERSASPRSEKEAKEEKRKKCFAAQ
jgi:hypothetical protein